MAAGGENFIKTTEIVILVLTIGFLLVFIAWVIWDIRKDKELYFWLRESPKENSPVKSIKNDCLTRTEDGLCSKCGFLYDPRDKYCRICGGRLYRRYNELSKEEQGQVDLATDSIIVQFLESAK